MKYTIAVISLFIVLGSQSAFANETARSRRQMLDETKPFEISLFPSLAIDFDDEIVGGVVRFAYSPSRVFSWGLQTGVEHEIDVEGSSTMIPVDIICTWDVPVGKQRVSIPISVVTGYKAGVGRSDLQIFTVQSETGVKVRLNDWVGLTVLMQGGFLYYGEYWPIPILGGKLGPFFSF